MALGERGKDMAAMPLLWLLIILQINFQIGNFLHIYTHTNAAHLMSFCDRVGWTASWPIGPIRNEMFRWHKIAR